MIIILSHDIVGIKGALLRELDTECHQDHYHCHHESGALLVAKTEDLCTRREKHLRLERICQRPGFPRYSLAFSILVRGDKVWVIYILSIHPSIIMHQSPTSIHQSSYSPSSWNNHHTLTLMMPQSPSPDSRRILSLRLPYICIFATFTIYAIFLDSRRIPSLRLPYICIFAIIAIFAIFSDSRRIPSLRLPHICIFAIITIFTIFSDSRRISSLRLPYICIFAIFTIFTVIS